MTNSTPNLRTMKIEPIDEPRLSEELRGRIDAWTAWTAAQPEPRPSRSQAIRRLLDEALDHNHRVTVPSETAVAVQLSAPASKSEELLRAAISAFADEIVNAPDDFEESPGEGAKDYEAQVRQAANSPYIDRHSIVDFIDQQLHKMYKVNEMRLRKAAK